MTNFSLPFAFRQASHLAPVETPASSASQARFPDEVDHLVGLHFRENLLECLVTANGDVVIDLGRIYFSVASKDNPLLKFVKGMSCSWTIFSLEIGS
jgi:hypothetical protein